MMFSRKSVPVRSVAELPTWKETLSEWVPFITEIDGAKRSYTCSRSE